MLKPSSPHFAKFFFILFGFLFIVGIAFWIMSNTQNASPSPTPSPADTSELTETTTTDGTMACLPHKDTKGPVTLECAYGIKTTQGNYYALDNALYPGSVGSLPIGAKVRVTGKITPVEELEKVRINVYDIKGSIVVADIEEL